ncbi:cobaltochelatase CobT-related protein [Caballeronia insecticola]|uniref:Putative cobalamin biosynthesis cobT protein n=1 Tax=Caballeronia insecticola TaxID=758793 RepID=R4X391_9BURK|nr:cobalamin biosynthesis cobT protein [Caballeronia insecticola]BAN26157.1 putative cobalamin biosynthesis cobT protein [Caballeronia insecticola]
MSGPRELARRDALCAATVRALTGDGALHYRGGRLYRHLQPVALQAPHLRGERRDDEPLASTRGAADASALRIAHSDAARHRESMPDDPVARVIFEMLEQLRCETLAPAGMEGVRRNVQHRFDAWSRACHEAGLLDSDIGLLIYTVAQMAASRLSGHAVLEQTEGLIEATRAALAPSLGVALAGLRRHRGDQRAYAVHALDIARRIGAMVRDVRHAFVEHNASSDDDDEEAARTMLGTWFDIDDEEGELERLALAMSGESSAREASGEAYRVFTKRYDETIRPATRIRAALLREYRERLDDLIAARHINVPRLARMLQASIAMPRRDGWSFGEEDGRIDGRRLAQVVASPGERRVFRRERERPNADCAVSFVIDCSGSMKASIEPVAVMIDVLVRALGMASVATEVLGFTTGAWNGGRAKLDWQARGKPKYPGRLNEACHMIFKEGDASWRVARGDIAALFKADLFREGIDGEALDWACARLLARDEARRIVVVISDGSPMDSATAQANDANYLDQHLREVVDKHETARKVEVLGLGVGLDLSPYYRHHFAVDLSVPPDMTLFAKLAAWLGARRRSRT